MSLAKKSVKWLVALFVIFALILTASVAVSNVARANAEPLETAEDTTAPSTVIVEVTDSVGNVYPNLANVENVTRTLTVNYYVEIPGDAGAYSTLKLSPVLVYADSTHVAKPNGIVINSALATYADLEYVTEYLSGAANAFSVSMKTGATISDLNGVDASGDAISNKYLVTATYVLSYEEEEDVVGAYELTFADDPQDEDDGSAIAPADEGVTYIPTIENGEFTISEIVEYPTVTPTSFVYDGEEKTVYSAVSNAYTYTGATGTVVDDYTITFSLNDFYIWHDTTVAGGYTRAPYAVDWEITKKQVSIPKAVSGLTFNGSEQEGVVNDDNSSLYDLGDWDMDDFNLASGAAKGTAAGDYTATFALVDTYNTEWANAEAGEEITNKTIAWSIAKRAITAPVSAGTVYTYNGQEQSFEFSEDPLTDAAYITITGTPQTNVGEYTVTAALTYPASTYWAGDATDVADKTFPFVINPALITVPTPANETYIYNGTAQSFQWADTPDALITITGTPQTNAGNYTITASIPANYAWDDENHTTADKTFPFVIAKVQITKPTPLDNVQYVYDSYNKQFMLDVVSAETGYYTISNNIRRNAGTQTVTVSLKDKTNTQWADGTTADLEFTFTVQPRPVNLSVSADAASHVYGNTPANVSISMTGAIDAFSCSYKVVCVDGEAPYAEYTPTQFNEGLNAGHYTLNPVYNDINGNYDVTVSEPFSYEITKKQVSIPKAVSGLTFNGSEQEGVVNDDNSSLYDLGDWDMDDFNLASGSAKGTAAGNYTATFALEDTDNTEWANAEAGEEITNKTIAWYIDYVLVTKPTATTTTYYYSGSEQTYAFASVGDSDKYTVANNKRTNAGTQTVTATLSNENYKWADGTTANLEFTFIIKKASVIAAPCSLDNTFTYTGEEITCNFISEGQQSYFTITGHKQTNVGTYDVTETLNDPNNYKWSHFPNVSDDEPTAPYVQENAFEITKKAVTIPTAISGLEYTGSAQVGVTKTDGSFYTLYSGSDEETAVGNYTATYNLKSTTNCYWAGDTTDVADKTVEWSIGKKQITKPSISASFKIYNGTSQSYSGSGTGYTFTGSGTNAGEYPVTVTLTDKVNSVWAGTDSAEDYNEADKLVINKKTVKLTLSESADSSVYGNSIATITAGINPDYAPINTADIGTVSYTAKNFQTNVVYTKADFETIHTAPVGSYILTAVCSVDNDNYSIDAQTLPYAITKRPIQIPVLDQDDPSFVYNGSAQGVSFISGSLTDAAYFTLSGTNSATNVGNYTYTATLNDATNCEWTDETTAAKNYNWSITTLYITVPTVVDDTFDYDGNEHSIGFSNVDNDYVDITYDTQSAIGVYTDTTTVALKAAHAGNIAWDDENHTTAAKNYTLTIELVEVNFTIVPIFNNTQKTGTATTRNVLFALPEATTYRWFKFTGYTFGGNAVSSVSLDMEGETVYANYTYAVGLGDADGDGVISSLDVVQLKRWNVGLDRAKKIATADAAWAKTDDSSVTSAVLYTALDANNSGKFTSTDIVAAREALATGYNFKIIVSEGIIQIAKVNRVNVSNYGDLIANIEMGNAVTLTTDIDAANEVFNENLVIPVDIDLGNHRLTVKGFTLNTATSGATLKVTNGTLYTVTGITVTAPNGNVVVADINGYSYDGTVVNLAAYSESLHIEDDVAFYIYKAQLPGTTTDYDDVDHFLAEVYPDEEAVVTSEVIEALNTTITTLADTRIGETEDRMADIAAIKADTERTEAQKAEDINALDVKKAILEVPVDTHVVVEESAKLSADKIVVKAQANEAATEEDVVKTFAIEVKNAEAEVVTVDISEVKETGAEVVYVVEEVAISGNTSKVEVVAGENEAAQVKKYVAQIGTTGYETLQAAINAAQNFDTIKLLDNVAISSTINSNCNITLDLNGKNITATDARALWVKSGSMSIIGTGTISANGENLAATSSVIRVGDSAVNAAIAALTIGKDVTVSSAKSYGITVFGKNALDANGFGSYLTVNGTVSVTGIENAISGNGTSTWTETNITINSTAVISSSTSESAIYQPQHGVLLIKSGAHITGATGVYIKSGDVTIEDGAVITATMTTAAPYTYYGDGNYPTGDGIVVDNCYYPGTNPTLHFGDDLEDTITVSNASAQKIASYWAVNTEEKLRAAIEAGATYIALNGNIALATGSYIVIDSTLTLDLNGYTISTNLGSDANSKGVFNLKAGANLTVNDTSAAGTGVITATGDRAAYGINLYSDSNATLTVNGGYIFGKSAGIYTNTNAGTVTINGGHIKSTASQGFNLGWGETYLVMNGGIIESESSYAIWTGSGAPSNDPSTATINGGKIITPKIEGAIIVGAGNVVINGGDFTETNRIFHNRATSAGHTFTFVINGGTFASMTYTNRANYVDSEAAVDAYIATGKIVVADGDNYAVFAVTTVTNEAELNAALAAGAKTIVLADDIEVTAPVVVDYEVVLNMNGKTIYNTTDIWSTPNGDWSLISVQTANGDLTITGDGTLSAKANDCYAIDVRDGASLTIVDGTYIGNVHAVYVYEGELAIYDGEFSVQQKYSNADPYGYVINLLDSSRTAGTASAVIFGGTYHGFNPADCSAEGPHTNFVAPCYIAVEDEGTWTVVEAEITITTFAELKAAIADVNAGNIVYPTLIIANDIAFEEELTISKSVYIKGDGEVKFIGYDASTKYDEAFYINVAEEDQEITIDGIVFDHFCYYSNVANKTKATASAVKNADSYITYGGNCPASTTLYITGCQFIGTARDMISVDSTIGCKGYIVIEDCVFDATDRLSSTLNMLSFYGNEDAELSVLISGCTFKEATEQNATWATSAIASFGNADITVTGCEFIACQIAIAIDNTFDRLFSAVTYPVYHNTTVTLVDNTYTNCYYGYYEESVVASVADIPEGAELYTDEPFTYGDEAATQFHFAAEYDLVVGGTQGVDAKYLVVACYYIAA